MWVARTVCARSVKSCLGEAMDKVCSDEGRGDLSLEAGDNVLSVDRGGLMGSWIRWST